MATPAHFSWVPSTARIIVLDGWGPVPRGTPPAPATPLAWPVKDPGDVLDYVLDLSEALAGNEGDGIATIDVQISPANPGDLVLQSATADGYQAILWFAAGFAGTIYAVTVALGTQSGRMISRTVNLPVQALATPPAPPNTLTDHTGAPVIDQTRSAITL